MFRKNFLLYTTLLTSLLAACGSEPPKELSPRELSPREKLLTAMRNATYAQERVIDGRTVSRSCLDLNDSSYIIRGRSEEGTEYLMACADVESSASPDTYHLCTIAGLGDRTNITSSPSHQRKLKNASVTELPTWRFAIGKDPFTNQHGTRFRPKPAGPGAEGHHRNTLQKVLNYSR